MKIQKHSGAAHLIIVIILVLGLVGSLGYIVWDKVLNKEQNVSSVQEDNNSAAGNSEKNAIEDNTVNIADLFTENISNFTNKTLIGTNDNYDVYILDIHPSDNAFVGNALVYSKSVKKALEINKEISLFAVGVSVSGLKQYGDNHLLIDSGTSPYRAKQLVVLAEKDVITFNSTVPAGDENVQYWNNYFIYSGTDSEYDGMSYKTSIFSLNLSTKEVKKLISWSGDKSYWLDSISGDTLNYVEFNGVTPESSSVTKKLTLDLNTIK